jgi:hypothetical protein
MLWISFRCYKTHINTTNELFRWWTPDFRQRGGTSGIAKVCWLITEGSAECCWLHGYFVGSFYQSSLWIGSMLSSGAIYQFIIDVFIHYVVSESLRVSLSIIHYPVSESLRVSSPTAWADFSSPSLSGSWHLKRYVLLVNDNLLVEYSMNTSYFCMFLLVKDSNYLRHIWTFWVVIIDPSGRAV